MSTKKIIKTKESHYLCEPHVMTYADRFDGTTNPNIFLDWLDNNENYFDKRNFTSTKRVQFVKFTLATKLFGDVFRPLKTKTSKNLSHIGMR